MNKGKFPSDEGMAGSTMWAGPRGFSSPYNENARAFTQRFYFPFPCADGLRNDAFVLGVQVFGDAKEHVLR